MFSEFCESPAISAVLPLKIALGHGCTNKVQQKFDSDTTVISTMCPSDCSTEDRDLLAKQLWSSVTKPSDDAVWASIRKQSAAKEKALFTNLSDEVSLPVVHVNSEAPPGLMHDYISAKTAIPPPPGLAPTCEFAKTTMDAFFADEEIFDQEPQVCTSLSSWMTQQNARGGKMTCAQAARLASSILSEADAAVAQCGSGALRAVQCDGIYLDKSLAPHLQHDAVQANISWLSPEEAIGSAGPDAMWAALSYRIGLLLHCVAVSGIPVPYPSRSDDAVMCGLFRAARGCGQPEEPFSLGDCSSSDNSSSRSRLMQSVISSCLRLSRPGPPDRRVVETSLAILSSETRLSV